MADHRNGNQDPFHLKRRCPRLGSEIQFEYCMESGEDDFACWKILDCWWEIFDVASYLKANLPEQEYIRLTSKTPKNKVSSILEQIEAAKKRTGKE